MDQGYYWITVSIDLAVHTRSISTKVGAPRKWHRDNLATEQAEAIIKYLTETHGFVEDAERHS